MNDSIWFPTANMRRQGWSFQSAAAVFFASKNEFLSIAGNDVQPKGQWELTCFPHKDFIGAHITKGHINGLCKFVHSLRDECIARKRYDAIRNIETIFKDSLAYPPSPLSTVQDRLEVERRAFAIRMFMAGKGFNSPPPLIPLP